MDELLRGRALAEGVLRRASLLREQLAQLRPRVDELGSRVSENELEHAGARLDALPLDVLDAICSALGASPAALQLAAVGAIAGCRGPDLLDRNLNR